MLAAGVALDPVAKLRTQGIFQATQYAKGVFEVGNDGGIAHLRSGLLCPATFPELPLSKLTVFPSPVEQGTDIDCEYARGTGPSLGNGRTAELVIHITKGDGTQTVNSAFTAKDFTLRQGVFKKAQFSEPQSLNPQIQGIRTPPNLAEKGFAMIGGVPYRTELLVMGVAGWVVEIRASFPADPQTGQASKDSDSQLSLLGLIQCAATITIL